jgi:hypothetical protein
MLSSSWSEQMNAIPYVRCAADASVSCLQGLVTRGTITALHLNSFEYSLDAYCYSVNVSEIRISCFIPMRDLRIPPWRSREGFSLLRC